MKKIITIAVGIAMSFPAVSFASSVDTAFNQVQTQILNAYYAGDQQLVAELFSVLFELLLVGQLSTENGVDASSPSEEDIEVETRAATKIEEKEARLNADIDWNDADRAYVWFEYGEDEDDLDEKTSRKSIDDDDDSFSTTIDDLDRDERYYFRVVVEDRDTGDRYRGDTESFRTNDERSSDEEPDVDTDEADDVRDESAELSGTVEMNDYRNGLVFFVWGEDESKVEDVEDEDQYGDVDEDGDDLQKKRMDRDLDARANYVLDLDGLDEDTRYYFTLCVEYEDDDDDELIDCGSIENFRTDRD